MSFTFDVNLNKRGHISMEFLFFFQKYKGFGRQKLSLEDSLCIDYLYCSEITSITK